MLFQTCISCDEHWGPNFIGLLSFIEWAKKKTKKKKTLLCSTEESIKIVNNFFFFKGKITMEKILNASLQHY